jgi:hypothetical protein
LYHSLVGQYSLALLLLVPPPLILSLDLSGGYCVSLTVNGVLSLNIPLVPEAFEEPLRLPQHAPGTDSPIRAEAPPKKWLSHQDQSPDLQTSRSQPLSDGVAKRKFYQRNPKKLFPFHSFLAVADPEELSDIMNKLGCTFKTDLEAPPLPSFLPEKTNPPPSTVSPSVQSLKYRALAAGGLDGSLTKAIPSTSASSAMPSAGSNVGLTGPVSSHQCSPLVYSILSNINPTISFAELRNQLDCSMDEVSQLSPLTPLASHPLDSLSDLLCCQSPLPVGLG